MKPECPSCGVEMTLQKVMNTNKNYKASRYVCEICDHQETIYGSGYRDIIIEPLEAVKEANEL